MPLVNFDLNMKLKHYKEIFGSVYNNENGEN